jgi:hypothetical protein
MCAILSPKKWVEVQISLSTQLKVQQRYKFSINKQALKQNKPILVSIKKHCK